MPAQVLVNDMQQKLGALDAEAAAAMDRARQMEAKASSLDSERALLSAAEQRLTRMVDELSADKHRLVAQSQVEQKVCVKKGFSRAVFLLDITFCLLAIICCVIQSRL
jgi:hypothetical protein